MNTWSFPNGVESKKETDPLTFTHNQKDNKNLDIINQEENPSNSNKNNNNIYKDLKFEGQRTNELRNYTTNKEMLNEDNQIKQDIDINNENENNDDDMAVEEDMERKEYEHDYEQENEDEYYYISEIIPPQNFPAKLRNIKDKYSKLKEEIEHLKKQIKKYNPNYVFGKYTTSNIP